MYAIICYNMHAMFQEQVQLLDTIATFVPQFHRNESRQIVKILQKLCSLGIVNIRAIKHWAAEVPICKNMIQTYTTVIPSLSEQWKHLGTIPEGAGGRPRHQSFANFTTLFRRRR